MTIKRVLIIGGYGNFGAYLAKVLGKKDNIQLIIAGRHIKKAKALIKTLELKHEALAIKCDYNTDLPHTLKTIKPHVVIHTSGPFQTQDFLVAKCCIHYGCHYIDLSDAIDFVKNIESLDAQATAKKVLICSGASSVPGLSSAIIDHFNKDFFALTQVDYAIATAQLTNQGLATTAGVLSYAGKPFSILNQSQTKKAYGWQGLRLTSFWQLGRRFLGNCAIPDLALFPKRYPTLSTIRFQAGLELKPLHFMLWCMSWGVRMRLLPSLDKLAKLMLKLSRFFDVFGSNNTGFYMTLSGLDFNKKEKNILFEIYAQNGDGLYIPCIPAILLTEKLCDEHLNQTGAMPCMGLITLTEYLNALKALELNIQWRETKH